MCMFLASFPWILSSFFLFYISLYCFLLFHFSLFKFWFCFYLFGSIARSLDPSLSFSQLSSFSRNCFNFCTSKATFASTSCASAMLLTGSQGGSWDTQRTLWASKRLCIQICMIICMNIYVCIYILIYVLYICMYICMKYLCIYACILTYVYICMYDIYMYDYMIYLYYIYIYICMYLYI